MRRQVAWCSLMLVVSGMIGAPAGAEEDLLGSRLRLSAPSLAEGPIVGTVIRSDDETIRLKLSSGKGTIDVPLAVVTRMEVGRRTSHAWEGFMTGVSVGALLTLLAAASTPACKDDDEICFGPLGVAVFGGAIFMGSGALVGGTAGFLVPKDAWREVDRPQWGVGLLRTREHGAGLALSLSF